MHHEPLDERLKLFNKILTAAVEAGASDIHMKTDAPVVFRLHRRLVSVEAPLPTQEWFEYLAETIIPKHAKAQLELEKGADFSYYTPGAGRFRTNMFLQRGAFAMVMRHVKSQVPSFQELGLDPQILKIAESPRGIVLMAGGTGSGKSTTLAAMISHLNDNYRKHIVTLEDPIEYSYEDNQCIIEQREIGLDCESFQKGMKHALRQDPDIILVGEMRDAISFRTAMGAADTGHLVMSTLHSTNAALSVTRILDFFQENEREQVRRQLSGTLQAIVAQRMVPKIGGGMVPAQEILINTPIVKKLIEENRLRDLPAAIETGAEDGMKSFNKSLLDLYNSGIISKDEALAKASNPAAMEMELQGIKLSTGSRISG
ncbi:MAG TPA: PilT/PilU family type 4a pilus ATPase [Roseimicrobium sp.]|nr:PilT/PilU family type 4a pilus ATPase [Roseimicrobium sp.]